MKIRSFLSSWFHNTCISFTVGVLILMATCEDTLTVGQLSSVLLACLWTCAMQTVFFSPIWIYNMVYALRLFCFTVIGYLGLAAMAWFLQWFPRTDGTAWLLFSGIFLGITGVLTLFFEIIFRLKGKKYQGLLGAYKRQRESQ